MRLKTGIVSIASLSVLLALASCDDPPVTKEQRMAKMKQSCQQAYGDRGETAVNECVLRLLTKALEEQEHDRMEQAERGAQ